MEYFHYVFEFLREGERMKKEIDMGIFLEDDARYADAVNVFGNMPKGTVTEEEVEPYDTKLHAVGTFLLATLTSAARRNIPAAAKEMSYYKTSRYGSPGYLWCEFRYH